jgi:hypothetical protein
MFESTLVASIEPRPNGPYLVNRITDWRNSKGEPTGVIGDGGFQEGRGADGFLVWLDLRESGARSIVDADMDELPADAAALAFAITCDAVTNAIKTSGFLDGDVDQSAYS